MAEYVRMLEPIVTPAQLEKTKAIIKQFAAPNGPGPKLHQYLVEKREKEDNWVSVFSIFSKKLLFLIYSREFLITILDYSEGFAHCKRKSIEHLFL